MSIDRARVQGVLGVGALLLIGMALGVTLDRTLFLPSQTEAATSPQQDHGVVVASLTEDLGLSDAQAAEVAQILERHQIVVSRAWEDTHRTLLAALDSVTNQIESVLRPDQIDGYHAWIETRHPPGERGRPNHLPH